MIHVKVSLNRSVITQKALRASLCSVSFSFQLAKHIYTFVTSMAFIEYDLVFSKKKSPHGVDISVTELFTSLRLNRSFSGTCGIQCLSLFSSVVSIDHHPIFRYHLLFACHLQSHSCAHFIEFGVFSLAICILLAFKPPYTLTLSLSLARHKKIILYSLSNTPSSNIDQQIYADVQC